MKKSLKLFEKAAEAGHPGALNAVGMVSRGGRAIGRWVHSTLRRSTPLNSSIPIPSPFHLSCQQWFDGWKGQPPDIRRAVEYFVRASESVYDDGTLYRFEESQKDQADALCVRRIFLNL